MRLQRAALRPLSFPTALSVSHHHMRLYGKTGSGGSSIASGRRLHAEEDGDAGDHGDGDGSQADGEAEQGDDAVTLGEADAGDEGGEGGNEAAQGDRQEEREGHEE